MCVFHLLREYWRNWGEVGFAEAQGLLRSANLAEGRQWAQRLRRAKALSKGLRHLTTGQTRQRTTSRLERHNRELRRREKLGTVWTEHNRLALQQIQGRLNQTT